MSRFLQITVIACEYNTFLWPCFRSSFLLGINRRQSIHCSESEFSRSETFKVVRAVSLDLMGRIGFLLRLQTIIYCCITWLIAAVIPVLFFLFECQYAYYQKVNILNLSSRIINVNQFKLKLYRNSCQNTKNDVLRTLLCCLIYSSYVCTVIVLVLYLLIIRALRQVIVIRTNH